MDKKSRSLIKQLLDKKPACYVLITCSQLDEQEEMTVEMTYQGDPTLVRYLLRDAEEMIDEKYQNEDKVLDFETALPLKTST